MKLAMLGLGRMGANMARRLQRGGHECIGFDLSADARAALRAEGFTVADVLDEVHDALEPPRIAWLMAPAGAPTDALVAQLAERFEPGDVLVDGGNTHFKDDVRRAGALRDKGIHLVDVGTSGGVWGLERGYCLMIGGEPDVVSSLEPIFTSLAPGRGTIARTLGRETSTTSAEDGWLHCGPVGSGHFVKMVHNGIEYGLMQAYAEGLDVLRGAGDPGRPADLRYDIDVSEVVELWRRGSVITSWLLDLTAQALRKDPALDAYSGVVPDSGEGRWMVETAIEEAVPTPALTAALFARFRSRRGATFADKVLSAMRHGFGGHVEPPIAPPGGAEPKAR